MILPVFATNNGQLTANENICFVQNVELRILKREDFAVRAARI